MLLRYSTYSQLQAFFRASVHVKDRIRVPRTTLVPTSTGSFRPKPKESGFSLPHCNPPSQILSLSQLPSLSLIPMTAPSSLVQPAQLTFSYMRSQSPKDNVPSMRACSRWGQLFPTVTQKSILDLGPIPVPRRQDRTPTSVTLPKLPDLSVWKWP